MRTIDRFNINNIKRVKRNAKIIYQFARYGSKGLSKVNPTLVFIDAVVSLGELYVSYSKYRQVQEQNRQLEIEIETLSHQLNNLKKELDLKEKKLKEELNRKSDIIEQNLENNRINHTTLQKAYHSSEKYFFKMKKEIEKYRKKYPFSEETKKIEELYYETLTTYTETTLTYIGG
jgi:predicted RNase H-like nuclease (RuvC/YqgF family)